MRKYKNNCVGCPSGMGCLGGNCPYVGVPVYYCDRCNCKEAEYRIDGDDYCEGCVKAFLKEIFNELSFFEQAEILAINIERIDD